jgi:hypothetical protein
MRLTALIATGAFLSLFSSSVQAQRLLPSGSGLSVAVAASIDRSSATSLGITTSSVQVAPRAELSYGVSPRVSLVGAIVSKPARIEGQEYHVRSAEMGLRYVGFAGRILRPFAEGGLAVRKFTIDSPTGDVSATNVGPWVAAGYQWFPGGPFAIEGAATYGRVTFESWRLGGTALALAPVQHQEIGVRVGARWFMRAR